MEAIAFSGKRIYDPADNRSTQKYVKGFCLQKQESVQLNTSFRLEYQQSLFPRVQLYDEIMLHLPVGTNIQVLRVNQHNTQPYSIMNCPVRAKYR